MSVIKVYGALFGVLIAVVLVVGHLKEGSKDTISRRQSWAARGRDQEREYAAHRSQQQEQLERMSGDSSWSQRLRDAARIGRYGSPLVTAWDLQNVLSSTDRSYVFVGKLANLERLPDERDRLTLRVLIDNSSYRTDRCPASTDSDAAVFLSIDLDSTEDRQRVESNPRLFANPDDADCLAVSARVTSIKAAEGAHATLLSGRSSQLVVIPKL